MSQAALKIRLLCPRELRSVAKFVDVYGELCHVYLSEQQRCKLKREEQIDAAEEGLPAAIQLPANTWSFLVYSCMFFGVAETIWAKGPSALSRMFSVR